MMDISGEYDVQRFRDGDAGRRMVESVLKLAAETGPVKLMEVCGTHTVSFLRSGLRTLLDGAVELVSGPGCPVCVTPNGVIDKAIAYASSDEYIVLTFGDMMRVPGSSSSLEKRRAEGGDVRIVYSTTDALRIASENRGRKVVFIGIGFETTSPTVAAAIKKAAGEGLGNFAVLSAHKLVPPALRALMSGNDSVKIQGFICPGHASAIIGGNAYREIAEIYSIPCVVTGFEPLDMLQGIYMILRQAREGRSDVEIQYKRVVTMNGNEKARAMLNEAFDVADTQWRGLGAIPQSGNVIKKEYEKHDAEKIWPIEAPESRETPGCRCADILTGKILPSECGMFGKKCVPEEPVGPCMVSSEGACAAHYRYGGERL